MLIHPTIDKLKQLRLSGMASALTQQTHTPDIEAVTFEDIQKVAQKVFRTGNLNLSLIGPVPEKMQRAIVQNLAIERT